MTLNSRIILASTSTIRQKLLRNAGIEFSVQASNFDESALKKSHLGTTPVQLAQSLAQAKSLTVSTNEPNAFVIGADQLLLFNQQIFDKPRNKADARSQLRALRGSTHLLLSAVCCTQGAEVLWTHCSQASLTMRDFSDQFLDHYLATHGDDLLTSVGAYKLEGPGAQLFAEIAGDYFTVLGLPLLPLLNFLRQHHLIQS